MDERNFFDQLAPTWDDNEVLSTPERINKILDFIQIEQNQSILDLGTGTGVLLPHIAEKIGEKGKIVAVDYSEGMLQRAKQKFSTLSPTPEFLNIDFETENIPGEFDRIILYCVFPHLHTPVETLKWLEKVNLKEKGIISIAFPCKPDFINKIHRERHSESDVLPSATVLSLYLRENGLNACVASETDDSYVINIKK